MAPKAKRKDVLIVSADVIRNEQFIPDRFQFLNAHFIDYICYILNFMLLKTFRLNKFSYMKDDVAIMIQVGDED